MDEKQTKANNVQPLEESCFVSVAVRKEKQKLVNLLLDFLIDSQQERVVKGKSKRHANTQLITFVCFVRKFNRCTFGGIVLRALEM